MRQFAWLIGSIGVAASACSGSSSSGDAGTDGGAAICGLATDGGASVGIAAAKQLSFNLDCTIGAPTNDAGAMSALLLGCSTLTWSFTTTDGKQQSLSGSQITATVIPGFLPYNTGYDPTPNQAVGGQFLINLQAPGTALGDAGAYPALSIVIPETFFNSADGGLQLNAGMIGVGSIDLTPTAALDSSCWYQNTCANLTLEAAFGSDAASAYVLGGVATGQQLSASISGQATGSAVTVSGSSLSLLPPNGASGAAVCGDGKIHY